jgi:Tat protein translocase TatB subunit
MFYLFIFESIGTSELMLIGLVALIVFGPRKLPELARTIGKTMAEFRRSTDDFKKTWEQEIAFEEEKNNTEKISDSIPRNAKRNEQTTSRNLLTDKTELGEPEIKQINTEDFDEKLVSETKTESQLIANKGSDKRDWL